MRGVVPSARGRTECRSCGEELHPLIDLGVSPLCESFLSEEQANCGEIFYPLDVKLCVCDEVPPLTSVAIAVMV